MHTSPQNEVNRDKLSSTLYKFAWAIEILAVCVGLTIAVMMMMASFTESMKISGESFGVMQLSNVIIAGLPFIMVAVTELTKIPFAQASYYTTSLLWKSVFTISLILISFITFESAFNGFERNDASLNYAIDKLRSDVNKLDESLLPKQQSIKELSELTVDKIESDFSKQTDNFLSEKQEKIKSYNEQISELRSSIRSESSELLTANIRAKEDEIKTLRRSREQDIKVERDVVSEKLSNINETLDIKRKTLEGQLDILRQDLRERRNSLEKALSEKGVFESERGIRENFEPNIKALENKISETLEKINNINPLQIQTEARNESQKIINDIRSKFAVEITRVEQEKKDLEAQLNQQIGSKEQDIIPQIQRLQGLIDKAEEQYTIQQKRNQDERVLQLEQLKSQKEQISELREEIYNLENQKIELRDQINVKVAENQIWRFAQKLYGTTSAADLKRDQVQLVANVFYGSLAALVALTGVMLAFASFVANDPKYSDRNHKHKSPKEKVSFTFIRAINSWRRYTAYSRKLKQKIKTPATKEIVKEIIKEVPVQKVVLTEKPVEIVRKELVHVPMYTNDKTLLKTNPEINLPENTEEILDNKSSSDENKKIKNLTV